MNRRIAIWAGGDSGKAGKASVLRPPGTANYKRHPKVDLVVGEYGSVESWDPDVLEEAIPPEPPAPASLAPAGRPYTGPALDLEDMLGVGTPSEDALVFGPVPDEAGTKYAVVCPWASEHSGGDQSGTFVGQFASGATWFHCHHEHCQGRSWQDFRRELQPVEKHIDLATGRRDASRPETRREKVMRRG
jgi:hypothetical protein